MQDICKMQDARKALLEKGYVLARPGMARNSSREKVFHKAALTSMRQAKGSSPPCYDRQMKLPMELKPYFL